MGTRGGHTYGPEEQEVFRQLMLDVFELVNGISYSIASNPKGRKKMVGSPYQKVVERTGLSSKSQSIPAWYRKKEKLNVTRDRELVFNSFARVYFEEKKKRKEETLEPFLEYWKERFVDSFPEQAEEMPDEKGGKEKEKSFLEKILSRKRVVVFILLTLVGVCYAMCYFFSNPTDTLEPEPLHNEKGQKIQVSQVGWNTVDGDSVLYLHVKGPAGWMNPDTFNVLILPWTSNNYPKGYDVRIEQEILASIQAFFEEQQIGQVQLYLAPESFVALPRSRQKELAKNSHVDLLLEGIYEAPHYLDGYYVECSYTYLHDTPKVGHIPILNVADTIETILPVVRDISRKKRISKEMASTILYILGINSAQRLSYQRALDYVQRIPEKERGRFPMFDLVVAVAHRRLGNSKAAHPFFKKVYEKTPNAFNANFLLDFYAWHDSTNRPFIEGILNKYADNDTCKCNALNLRPALLDNINIQDRQKAHFEYFIHCSEGDPLVTAGHLWNLAWAFHQQGDFRSALTYLKLIRRYDPSIEFSIEENLRIFQDARDWRGAIDHLDQKFQYGIGDYADHIHIVEALNNYRMMLWFKQMKASATLFVDQLVYKDSIHLVVNDLHHHLSALAAMDPRNPAVQFSLAQNEIRDLGWSSVGISTLHRLTMNDTVSDNLKYHSLLLLAETYFEMGMFDACTKPCERAIDLDPTTRKPFELYSHAKAAIHYQYRKLTFPLRPDFYSPPHKVVTKKLLSVNGHHPPKKQTQFFTPSLVNQRLYQKALENSGQNKVSMDYILQQNLLRDKLRDISHNQVVIKSGPESISPKARYGNGN